MCMARSCKGCWLRHENVFRRWGNSMSRRHFWIARLVFAALAISVCWALPTSAFQTKKPSPPKETKKSSSDKTQEEVRPLDDILEPIRRKHQLPALAAAVMQADRIVAI